MTYHIEDFSPSDWGQYFADSYVKWTTKAGKERVGNISGFAGSKVIVKDELGTATLVDLSSIRWSGLTKTRCIAYRGSLVFVSPGGTRDYKKPPTLRNTIALMYDSGDGVPRLMGTGTERGRLNEQIICAYLDDREEYPVTYEDVLTLFSHGQYAIPLSQSHGVLYCDDRDVNLRIVDGALMGISPGYGGISDFIREANNGS